MPRCIKLIAVAILVTHAGGARGEEDDGKIAFNNHCRTCHSFKQGDNRLGPSISSAHAPARSAATAPTPPGLRA